MNSSIVRQQHRPSARQTVAAEQSRGGLQKQSPQQQQEAANKSGRAAPAVNKIDYEAQARNGRELETSAATTFVIYENLNARRLARRQEADSCHRRLEQQHRQQHGHLLLSSAVRAKIATSQEQQSKSDDWSRVVSPSQSSGRRREQQVASFECGAARQMRGSAERQRYSNNQHFIKLQLRCQDVGGQRAEEAIVVGREQHQQEETMKSSRQHRNQSRGLNCASPPAAIKIRNHLMNGDHEPLPTPTASGGESSPLSPLQNHNNFSNSHLLLSASGGQTCGSPSASSTINNRNTHTLNSHRSTRSTATDSSGFSSEASTTSCRTSSSHQQVAAGQRSSSKESATSSSLIRSRLIEDLNRLEKIAAAAKAQRVGAEQLTTAACSVASTPAATLSRTSHVELDYSTLCRDEFSSFIAYRGLPTSDLVVSASDEHEQRDVAATSVPSRHKERELSRLIDKMPCRDTKKHRTKQRSAHKPATRGGPMLVGVHECETPRDELAERVPDLARSISSSASSEASSPACSPDQNNLNSACSSSPIASLSTGSGHDQEYQEQFGDEDFDEEDPRLATTPIDHKNNNHLLSRPRHEAHIEEYFSDESDHRHEVQNHHLYEPQEDQLSSLEDHSDHRQANPPIEYKLELNLLPKEGEDDKLSEMLDVYLSRVESLLRLAKGDKSIKLNEMSVGELDNGKLPGGGHRIEISEEFKTRIAYVPSPRRVDKLPEVIQELEMLEEQDDDDGDDQENQEEKSFFLTNIVSDNFKALLSSPQTSAKLNWWPNQLEISEATGSAELGRVQASGEKVDFIDEHQRQLLEQSFLKKWLELGQQDGDRDEHQQNKQRYYESLVRTVRRHMGEFVSNYNTYQATMREETSFARDWHANWLFATTKTMRANLQSSQKHQQVANKRAKLMSPEPVATQSCQIKVEPPSELLNYSTLLLAKYKPIKVAYVGDDDDDSGRQEGVKYKRHIDTCYEQQPEQVDELQRTFQTLNGQVNVCQLMLSDSFADSESLELKDEEEDGRGERKPLEVSYESSLCAGRPMIDGQLMSFRAHGHLFELRRLRQFFNLPPPSHANPSTRQLQTKARKLEALKQLVLVRLSRACHHGEEKLDLIASQLPLRQVQRDQVRFLVHISSVQVSQPLPVIQFCAKITGALPIRVSWHKQEGGDQYDELTRARGPNDEWPLTMAANYELEYQNKWSSWYRFRRRQGEVLFEIREPSARHDYDRTYKCVIENYCSIRECEFTLQVRERDDRREPTKVSNANTPQPPTGKSRRLAKSASRAPRDGLDKDEDEIGRARLNRVECGQGESQEAGQAILRTWSQRTLNKRAPLVTSDHLLAPLVESQQFATGSAQHSQTVGRLSARAQDECKFGTDYPYHPVSLMRRLEENKMSLTLGSRLRGLSSGGMTTATITQQDGDRYYDLTTEDEQPNFMGPATGGSNLKPQDERQELEDNLNDQQQHESTSGRSSTSFQSSRLELPTPRPRQKPPVVLDEPLEPPSSALLGPNQHPREPLKELSNSPSVFANQVVGNDCATSRRRPVDDDDGGNNYRRPSTGRCVAQERAILCQSTPTTANDDDESVRHHHSAFERTAAKSWDGEQFLVTREAASSSTSKLDKPRWRRPGCNRDEQDDDGRPADVASQQQPPSEEIVKSKSVRSLISRFNMG